MADRNFNATGTPQNINSVLSLTAGAKRRIQNVDPAAALYLREAAVMPTGGALRGFRLAPYDDAYWEVTASVGMWAWTNDGRCACVVGNVS